MFLCIYCNCFPVYLIPRPFNLPTPEQHSIHFHQATLICVPVLHQNVHDYSDSNNKNYNYHSYHNQGHNLIYSAIFQPAGHYSTWIIFHLACRSSDGWFPCFSSTLLKTSRHLVGKAKLCVDSPSLFWSGCRSSTPKQSSHNWHLQDELSPDDIWSSGYLVRVKLVSLKISIWG